MAPIPSKIVLFLLLNLLLLGKSHETRREGKDFHSFLPSEEGKRPDYQVFQYPHNYGYKDDYSEECTKNPMIPFLGKGLSLILLKLGVFGIIKAVMALIFLGFLVKIPLLLLKAALVKSFFLPLLVAPLVVHLLMNQMNQSNESASDIKPGGTPEEIPGAMGMNEMNMDAGRQLDDNLTSVAWKSMKMFAESDQCVERMFCIIGASSRDSSLGNIFARMLQYFPYSSPPTLEKRIKSIKEAFGKGRSNSVCSVEDYDCQSPELLLQYGMKKLKIL